MAVRIVAEPDVPVLLEQANQQQQDAEVLHCDVVARSYLPLPKSTSLVAIVPALRPGWRWNDQ